MPVRCVSVAVTPSVANGVRTRAWKEPSGIRRFSRERADAAQQVLGNQDAGLARLVALLQPARARKAHARLLEHRRDKRLHPLEEDLASRERRRVDREECLADARGASFL